MTTHKRGLGEREGVSSREGSKPMGVLESGALGGQPSGSSGRGRPEGGARVGHCWVTAPGGGVVLGKTTGVGVGWVLRLFRPLPSVSCARSLSKPWRAQCPTEDSRQPIHSFIPSFIGQTGLESCQHWDRGEVTTRA